MASLIETIFVTRMGLENVPDYQLVRLVFFFLGKGFGQFLEGFLNVLKVLAHILLHLCDVPA